MSPPDAALAYSRAEIASALVDPAVLRVVWRAARDVRMRQAFQTARRDGARVDEIVEVLCGPHVDVDGRTYFLSDERVRSIVYRKSLPEAP